MSATKILLENGWEITKNASSWTAATFNEQVTYRIQPKQWRVNENKLKYFLWLLSLGANFPQQKILAEHGNEEVALICVSRGMTLSKSVAKSVCSHLDGNSETTKRWWENFHVRDFLTKNCQGLNHLSLFCKREMKAIEALKNAARNFLPLNKDIIEFGVNRFF
jgi:hypothetical protein